MADTVRMNLNVDPDVPKKLAELAGGPKKMGSYLSVLIHHTHSGSMAAQNISELELLSGAVKHLSAKVKELDARIQIIEERYT